jgi:predicted Fe-S protein YdhL (DUF1289 family)
VKNHKTASRLLMHKECATQDLGTCSGCSRSLDDIVDGVIAVNFAKSQRSCAACAVRNSWKCAPLLRKRNRLSGFFKKYA